MVQRNAKQLGWSVKGGGGQIVGGVTANGSWAGCGRAKLVVRHGCVVIVGGEGYSALGTSRLQCNMSGCRDLQDPNLYVCIYNYMHEL